VNVLVCVKRVPAPGGRIGLTEDQKALETRHLGFTVSPHEECAIEEAVQIVERHGGTSTVLTLGTAEAEEQLRMAISMGADHAVLVEADDGDWDPEATSRALINAIQALTAEGESFDLVMFGNESADAGHHQVGIRVAHALGLPIVSGIKGIDLDDGKATLRRDSPEGYELYEVDLPAAAAVKEGINLPRYPTMKGRLRARNAEIRRIPAEAKPGGLRRQRFVYPPQDESETVILGDGPDAASRVADILAELGLL
jgi:electron transfer flavoprotein beta subunit